MSPWKTSEARAKFLAEKRMTVSANLLTWLTIHGNVCLALRHPENRGASRPHAVNFVKFLGEALVKAGVISPKQLLEAEKMEIEQGSLDLKRAKGLSEDLR